jgi:hypothetical protein
VSEAWFCHLNYPLPMAQTPQVVFYKVTTNTGKVLLPTVQTSLRFVLLIQIDNVSTSIHIIESRFFPFFLLAAKIYNTVVSVKGIF